MCRVGGAYHKIHRPALSVYSRGSHEVAKSYRDNLTEFHKRGRTHEWAHVPCLQRKQEGYGLQTIVPPVNKIALRSEGERDGTCVGSHVRAMNM
jgi:hypothetical protein